MSRAFVEKPVLRPPAIGPDALIGLIAPASPVKEEYVVRGVKELERHGFRVRLARHLYERGRYTAGSARARFEDLMELWESPDVDALFCARGGYGSMELLSRMDPKLFRERPKVFVGASDATALLAFLGASAGIVSFHGPMVAQDIARGAYDVSSLLRLIRSREPGPLTAQSLEVLHAGSAEGRLWGGCLSIVTALVGTPYLPRFEDSVLFLEDTQVKPYQIDRMLMQLRLAGCLESVRGLVFGQMPACEQHPDQGYTLKEMLRDTTRDLDIPVTYGFPSGHTRSDTVTIPLGVRVRLDDDGLTALEGAVE